MVGALRSFDLPLNLYADDVRDMAGICIERYGLREWRLAVLTSEIHGHLGIYAVLGAKMGLLARERFEAEGLRGDCSVLSFAGNRPPVSCLNDGLQVSTGASLGHGLIAVSDEPEKRVEARFRLGDRAFGLRLRPDLEAQVRDDIARGVAQYGHAPAYWQYVRGLALRYWRDWNRRSIFEETDFPSDYSSVL